MKEYKIKDSFHKKNENSGVQRIFRKEEFRGSVSAWNILDLQQKYGNTAVNELFSIELPCEKCESATDADQKNLTSGNESLNLTLLKLLENNFNAGLSNVKIHTDIDAQREALIRDAKAFTIGSDIYFGSNQYRPETETGRQLIAHEMTHVLQQMCRSENKGFRSPEILEQQARTFSKSPLSASISANEIGTAPAGIVQADNAGELELHFRGEPGQKGIGVLYVKNWNQLKPEEKEAVIAWGRDVDFQASGGLNRQKVGEVSRRAANSVARLGRRALGLQTGQSAGHTSDVAGGGSPVGVIRGLPSKVNSSFGGQWKRYKHGFVFTGLSIYNHDTGEWIYLSQGLENEPPPLKPGPPPPATLSGAGQTKPVIVKKPITTAGMQVSQKPGLEQLPADAQTVVTPKENPATVQNPATTAKVVVPGSEVNLGLEQLPAAKTVVTPKENPAAMQNPATTAKVVVPGSEVNLGVEQLPAAKTIVTPKENIATVQNPTTPAKVMVPGSEVNLGMEQQSAAKRVTSVPKPTVRSSEQVKLNSPKLNFRASIRNLAGTAVSIGFNLLDAWIQQKLIEKMYAKDWEQKVWPEIERRLNALEDKAIEMQIQLPDDDLFAVISLTTTIMTTHGYNMGPSHEDIDSSIYLGTEVFSVQLNNSSIQSERENTDSGYYRDITEQNTVLSLPLTKMSHEDLVAYAEEKIRDFESVLENMSIDPVLHKQFHNHWQCLLQKLNSR